MVTSTTDLTIKSQNVFNLEVEAVGLSLIDQRTCLSGRSFDRSINEKRFEKIVVNILEEKTPQSSVVKAEEDLDVSLKHLIIWKVDGSINLCQIDDKQLTILTSVKPHTDRCTAVISCQVYDPSPQFWYDEFFMISGGWDSMVCMSKFNGEEILWKEKCFGPISSLDVSCDRQFLIVAFDEWTIPIIKKWKIGHGNGMNFQFYRDIKHTLTIRSIHKRSITKIMFSSNGHQIISSSLDGSISITDATTASHICKLKTTNSSISTFTLTCDERNIICGNWHGEILSWDIATGRYRKDGPIKYPTVHHGIINRIISNVNGRSIVTIGFDGQLIYWDTDTQKILWRHKVNNFF
ncbi:hypothetical protein SNEBB_011246 [Seison nebaliae]|nr:hypothetical protein SNEBB_011246 [Seison nebaliae]